jgi:hypothetical protein
MDEPSKYEKKQLKKEQKEQEKEVIRHKYKTKKTLMYVGIAVVLIIVISLVVYVASWMSNQPGQHDDFAKCLTEKGAKIYGADWCHNCQSQKRKFGKSFQYVEYIECERNPQQCLDAGIESYPTWIYNDETRVGVRSLEEISSWTGCEL